MTLTTLKVFDRKSYEKPKDELTLARERLAAYQKELELATTQEELAAISNFREEQKHQGSVGLTNARKSAALRRGGNGGEEGVGVPNANVDNLADEIKKRQKAKKKKEVQAQQQQQAPPEVKEAEVVEQTC